jgi:hypothetical protein
MGTDIAKGDSDSFAANKQRVVKAFPAELGRAHVVNFPFSFMGAAKLSKEDSRNNSLIRVTWLEILSASGSM